MHGPFLFVYKSALLLVALLPIQQIYPIIHCSQASREDLPTMGKSKNSEQDIETAKPKNEDVVEARVKEALNNKKARQEEIALAISAISIVLLTVFAIMAPGSADKYQSYPMWAAPLLAAAGIFFLGGGMKAFKSKNVSLVIALACILSFFLLNQNGITAEWTLPLTGVALLNIFEIVT